MHKMSAEEIERRLKKKEFDRVIRTYKKTQHIFLMTSIFNNRTAEENEKFRKSGWPDGCMYCSPKMVSDSIPIQSKLMVLEMNNDTNKIMAVGLCLNRPFIHKYKVYEDENYNRYSYVGKYRIARADLDKTEEAIFKALDILCFTGNDHMKRNHGIKQFPAKLLYNCRNVLDIPSFIENMFKNRFSKKNI